MLSCHHYRFIEGEFGVGQNNDLLIFLFCMTKGEHIIDEFGAPFGDFVSFSELKLTSSNISLYVGSSNQKYYFLEVPDDFAQ